ncbi:MAG: hypothetical protein M9894_21005 [Planctomycetes bacterium]|nr:hypothetical protein [Planctomycetota bacterium]
MQRKYEFSGSLTPGRQPAHGPTWRAPAPRAAEADDVFVVCRCGTDMSFRWPTDREAVRCFACGSRFPRPGHLPAPAAVPPWQPAAARPRRLTWGLALLLLLVTLAAGALGAAVGLALGRPSSTHREDGQRSLPGRE